MTDLKTKAIAALISLTLTVLTITPAWAAEPARFTDVKPGSWYAANVTALAGKGLISGCGDGTFRPMKTITAAEFVSIVARCAGFTGGPAASGHWAASFMSEGLSSGWYDWDEIPPTGEKFNKPIARQLAAKILMRALLPDKRGDYNTESAKIADFKDLDGRYYESVLAAYSCGILAGDGSGRFNPKSGMSRAEACAIVMRALAQTEGQPVTPAPDVPDKVETISGGVSENGWLQVKGTQLCNGDGKPVALHGMSSHGLQWFGQFANEQSIKNTSKYGANLFRVAMYTGENGYLSQPEQIKKQAVAAIDAAIKQDMYVIIDWHILSDGNPMDHLNESKAFFTEISKRYKDEPAVIYEICNEPNGGAAWSRDIKPYATELVKAIRKQSEKGIILIGSSTWSQDVHLAAADPVGGENLMYTLHFYAGTHGQWLRDRAGDALKAGLPLFVSEWGTSSADGSGGVFLDESKKWLDFLDKNGISWANWSLCDKNETSAALKPGTSPNKPWAKNDLSESGRFVFDNF